MSRKFEIVRFTTFKTYFLSSISLMIAGSAFSLFGFIKSFIAARKARENS